MNIDAVSVADDPRFTIGLYLDVIAVLEKHRYVSPSGKEGITARADVLVGLLHMVRDFEGSQQPPKS